MNVDKPVVVMATTTSAATENNKCSSAAAITIDHDVTVVSADASFDARRRDQRTSDIGALISCPEDKSVANVEHRCGEVNGGGASQPLKLERPKSAWKSRARRPRFTDLTHVASDADIDTLILDDDQNGNSDAVEETSNEPMSPSNHPGFKSSADQHHQQLQRQANKYLIRGDSDDRLSSKLNPMTPRAWQAKDETTIVDSTTSSSSLQFELRLALVNGPQQSDCELPSINASSGSRQRGSTDGGTPTSDSLSNSERRGSDCTRRTSETANDPSDSEQFGKSGIVSIGALANIHKKVLEKYQKTLMEANTDVQQTTVTSPSSSAPVSFVKHAHYLPHPPPRRTAATKLTSDGVIVAQSKIPFPVRKLVPIDRRVKVARSKLIADKHSDEHQLVSSAAMSIHEDNNERKIRLKPLIGRRSKEMFNNLVAMAASESSQPNEPLVYQNYAIERRTTLATANSSGDEKSSNGTTTAGPRDEIFSNDTTTFGRRDRLEHVQNKNAAGVANFDVLTMTTKNSSTDANFEERQPDRRFNIFSPRSVGEKLHASSMTSTYPPLRADLHKPTVGHVFEDAGRVTTLYASTDLLSNDISGTRSSFDSVLGLESSAFPFTNSEGIPNENVMDIDLREFSLYASTNHQLNVSRKSPLFISTSRRTIKLDRNSEARRTSQSSSATDDAPTSFLNETVSNEVFTESFADATTKVSGPMVWQPAVCKSAERPAHHVGSSTNAAEQVDRSLGVDVVSSAPLAGATSLPWDPQFSLTDMWAQLQSASQMYSPGSAVARRSERIASYMQ